MVVRIKKATVLKLEEPKPPKEVGEAPPKSVIPVHNPKPIPMRNIPVIHVDNKPAPKEDAPNEVIVGSSTITYPYDLNRWPLTTMWVFGAETEVNRTADMMPLGVIPWRIDVHERLEKVIGHPVKFRRSVYRNRVECP